MLRTFDKNNTAARYLVAGGLSYCIELGFILLFHKVFGFSAELSTAIAFWIGLTLSFILQKIFTFKNYQKEIKVITSQVFKYALLVLFNYGFTLSVVAAFPARYLIFSRTLALAITTTWNYFLYRIFFNQQKSRFSLKTLGSIFWSKKSLFWLALCAPIIAFDISLLLTGSKIIPGDPDYFMALSEAFRKTVLHYHEFPFWNPWLDGGIPLFGNIQMGVVSIQAPLILIFGAPLGWKLAIVVYHLVAFFGFRKLFKDYFKTPAITANLLAYIPVFSSIFTYRIIGGHFTFLLLAFSPWLIYFFLCRERKRSWIWFSLVFSFMIWSAPHYATIMTGLVVGIWYFYSLVALSIRSNWIVFKQLIVRDLRFWIKSAVLIGLLVAYRIIFVLSFIKDFPRPEPTNSEKYTGLIRGLEAIWRPSPYNHPVRLPSGWGWIEASAYIGIGTLAVVILILASSIVSRWVKHNEKKKDLLFSVSPVLIGMLFVTFFVLGMGNFGKYSPYVLLSHLPVFNNMRVATRWLAWSSFSVLFFIAAYQGRRYRKLINIGLFLAAAELFIIGVPVFGQSYTTVAQQYRPAYASFNEVYRYRLPRPLYIGDKKYQMEYPYDENLYETTMNNYGQVIAGDSLVDTRQPGKTIRCGINEGGCNLISSNAKITYWSPDKIILQRTAPGWIQLNMNPGRGWTVNGKYAFLGYKVTDPLRPFIVKDPSRKITLAYTPKYSIEWLFNRL